MSYVRYNWVIRTLNPKVEKDKKSIAHASAGIGYYIISTPETGKNYYVVAYMHFGGEIPVGHQLANKYQAEKLEKMRAVRYSIK